MGIFKSDIDIQDLRTPQKKYADRYATRLLKAPTPNLPEEEIAGMSEAEQLAQKLVMDYGESTPEGLDVLRGIANAPEDITQDPTIAALIAATNRQGDLSANRLARSLMLRGGTGGAGRDVLGRAVTQNQQNLLSTLAPYAESAKNRRMTAAQLLNTLGQQSTLNRLNALGTTGALPRTLKQLQNTARYQKAMQEALFPYKEKLAAVGAIGEGEQMVTEEPSYMVQLANLASQSAQAAARSA